MVPTPAPAAPRVRPGQRAPQTEGFGLVRRPPPAPRRDPDDDLRAPVSPRQREALHALVHARSSAPGTRWARRDRGIDFVWAGTLALLLALAASSIDSGRIFVATADRLHAVAEARSAVAAAAVARAGVASQSSPGTSRTM